MTQEARMRKALLTASAVLALTLFSCLEMENTFTINENGGGRCAFRFRLSRLWRAAGREDSPLARFPGTADEFRQALQKAEGVAILQLRQWEDESDLYLQGELDFKSVAGLSKSVLFARMPVTLVKEGAKTIFTLALSEKKTPWDEETLDLYRGLFADYKVTIKVIAPRVISEWNRGEPAADKKILTYEININDFMRLNEKTELRVGW